MNVKLLHRVILGGLIAASLVMTLSCKNFLAGNDLRNTLEEKVAYANAPYAKIEITSEGNHSLLVPAPGHYDDSFKAGDFINLQFKPIENFDFICWQVTPDGAVTFADPKSLSTTATVQSAAEPITIKPYAIPKDKLTVSFNTEYGLTVPSELKSYYEGETFSVSYRENNSNHAFIRWDITDTQTGKAPEDDIIDIEGTGSEITVTVKKVGKSIKFEAVTTKRPKIVSNIPTYTSDGSFRDRCIVIIFDTEIELSSIYWTKDELGNKASDEYKKTIDGTDYYSAYKNEDGEIFFKNISITKRLKNTNLMNHYEAPEFDEFDKSILRIKTKKNNEPPEATDILVTAKKELYSYSKEFDTNVEMDSDFSWSYYTSGSIDNVLNSFETSVTLNNSEGIAAATNQNEITGEDKTYSETIKNNNLTDKKLWVTGSITDGSSGPAAIKWELFKVNDLIYENKSEADKITNGQFELGIAASTGTIKQDNNTGAEVDLSSYLNNIEGMFKFRLIGSDKNGNEATNDYYFIYDDVAPATPVLTKIKRNTNNVDLTVSFPNNKDFYQIVAKETKSGEETSSKNIISVPARTTDINTFTIYAEDYCNNRSDGKSEKAVPYDPAVGMIYYSDGYYSNNYISGKTPEGVICKTTENPNKFYIWDIYDQRGYAWGNTASWIKTEYQSPSTDSGIDIYNKLIAEKPDILKSLCFGRSNSFNVDSINDRSASMWTYIKQKNYDAKASGNNDITWFIPNKDEAVYIWNCYEKLVPVYNKLRTELNKPSEWSEYFTVNTSKNENIDTKIFKRIEVIREDEFYWTSNLYFDQGKIAGAPFAIKINTNHWKPDGTYEQYSKNITFNNQSINYWMVLPNLNFNGNFGGWFYMDRCMRCSNDRATNDDYYYDMNTHAMALVNSPY